MVDSFGLRYCLVKIYKIKLVIVINVICKIVRVIGDGNKVYIGSYSKRVGVKCWFKWW